MNYSKEVAEKKIKDYIIKEFGFDRLEEFTVEVNDRDVIIHLFIGDMKLTGGFAPGSVSFEPKSHLDYWDLKFLNDIVTHVSDIYEKYILD